MRILSALLISTLMGSASAGVFRGDWLELIDTSKLPILREDECLQVSSYDRTGGNDDGFSGTYSFLREEDGAYVIFEDDGPGCVYRIWSANPGARRIEFYFDGEDEPRLAFDNWEDMFLGKVEPFVPPVSDHVIGGWISYVPMPYEKSLKIVTRERINFYQITYQKFAEGDDVKTFEPKMNREERRKFEQVCEAWENLGQHPWPQVISERSENATVIEPGKEGEVIRIPGCGILHSLQLRVQCDDPRWLRKVTFSVVADQQPAQVAAPFGDFFLQPFRGESAQSLLCGRDPNASDTFYSYWPMPYVDSIQVLLNNESNAPVSVSLSAGYEVKNSLGPEVARFHAQWQRQNPTVADELFPILDAWGRGHWCGVSMAMHGFGPGLGYLEGDELLWIDDRDHHSFNGTGSEDYYNGGWYFGRTGSFPYFGCGLHDEPGGRCHAFRIHMTDLVPYQRHARIGIEHGHANEYEADYAGTTYWYAAPGGRHIEPEMLPVDERLWLPETLHGYDEAEALAADDNTAPTASHEAWPADFSGGAALALNAVGDVATLRLKPEASDVFMPILHVVPAEAGTELEVRIGDAEPYQLSFDEMAPSGVDHAARKVRIGADGAAMTVALKRGRAFIDALRLRPSEKLSGVTEGEGLEYEAVGDVAGTVQDVLDGDGVSGDSALHIHASESGAGIAWNQTIQQEGKYEVVVRYRGGSGEWNLRVDGDLLGSFDGGTAPDAFGEAVIVGVTPPLTAGDHRFALTTSGDSGEIWVDYWRIVPAGQREGESLPIVSAGGGPVGEQRLGDAWSNGSQLWFRPTDAGAAVEVEVSVLEAGEYEVCGYFTKAPDYGIYSLSIDGETLPARFDGYAPSVTRSEEFCFGTVQLAKGLHRFRFEAVDKQRRSSSYMFGLDVLILR